MRDERVTPPDEPRLSRCAGPPAWTCSAMQKRITETATGWIRLPSAPAPLGERQSCPYSPTVWTRNQELTHSDARRLYPSSQVSTQRHPTPNAEPSPECSRVGPENPGSCTLGNRAPVTAAALLLECSALTPNAVQAHSESNDLCSSCLFPSTSAAEWPRDCCYFTPQRSTRHTSSGALGSMLSLRWPLTGVSSSPLHRQD